MSNFLPPRFRATGTNGEPLVGALLYFYETGTVTALATYSDEALTVANANPVVSDANGYCGAIYLQVAAYTVVLKTSAGVTIWTVDGVRGSYLSNATIATRLAQISCTPLDYGAVGDGVADETTAVQAAITAASCVVDLMGKTFKCNSTVSLKSGIVIKNGTIVTSSNTGIGFQALGTASTANALTAACAWAHTVTIASTAGFAAGDWAAIYYTAGATPICEVVQIKEVVNATTLCLDRDTVCTYPITDSLIAKLTPVDNVKFDNVKFVGSSSADARALMLNKASNISLTNCIFSGSYHSVGVARSAKVAFVNCEFGGYSEDGVFITDGSYVTSFDRCRFTGTVAAGVASGCGICLAEDPTALGIFCCHDVSINECKFARQAYGIRGYLNGSYTPHGDLKVYGCRFEEMTYYAIYCRQVYNEILGFVHIRDCVAYAGTAGGDESIYVRYISGGILIEGCTVHGEGIYAHCDTAAGPGWKNLVSVVNCNCDADNAAHGIITTYGDYCIVIGNLAASLSTNGDVSEIAEHNILDP